MNETSRMKKPDDTSLSFSDELARTVLNSLSAHIAILDKTGLILETNNAWQTYSAKSGMPADYDYRNINYLEVCDAAQDGDAEDARKVA
ncbi:MAG: helix-turn-helix transcriptional regulator, partial [Planctomycetota bacterium]